MQRFAGIALAFAAALSWGGCSTEDSSDTPAGQPQPGARAGDPSIKVSCSDVSKLPAEDGKAILSAAQSVYQTLRDGANEELWSSLHPQASDETQREAFFAAAQNMKRRLDKSLPETSLEHAYFVDVKGGVSDLTRVDCGPDRDPNALTLIANAGDEDLAMATVVTRGNPFGYATTIQLRRRGARWRLLGVQVSPSSYMGKTAAEYERVADTFVVSADPLEAYLLLGVAQQLAARGGSVKTARLLQIEDKLTEIGGSEALAKHFGPLIIGGKTFEVLDATLAATQSDISPVIKYVSPGGLIKEILDGEADQLIAHLRTTHPQLSKHFDAIVFEAYAQKPVKPDVEYDAYRIVRKLAG